MNYIGKRGFVLLKNKYSSEKLEKIKNELTVVPLILGNNPFVNSKPFKVYLENQNKLYLPRFYGIEKFGLTNFNELDDLQIPEKLKFNGTLRQYQIEPATISLKVLKERGGGLLQLYPGAGKTTLALFLITQLNIRSLIVVHKEFLMNQWISRIQQFIPQARVGIIQQNKIDIKHKDIVIGMLQSISMKDYAGDLFDSFGFVIFDEVHHLAGSVFSRAMWKIPAKFRLGLSATMARKDGLSKVFKWHLGDVIYKATRVFKGNIPIVKIYKYSNEDSEIFNIFNKPNVPKMISNITKDNQRNHLIKKLIIEVAKEGRKLLVLSERRNHLETIKNLIEFETKEFTIGFYMGKMKQHELNESEKTNIILGTTAMTSEALDIPDLNTLVLCTPKGEIEQIVGRILRKDHLDIAPKIIDIADQFSVFINQSFRRKQFYRKQGYKIIPEDKSTKSSKSEKPIKQHFLIESDSE